MRHLAILLALMHLLMLLPDHCVAQQTSRPEMTYAVTPAGAGRHVPGRWAMVNVTASNRSANDVEETIVVSLDQAEKLQFARQLWVPAGARRGSWLPIWIPELDDPELQHLTMTSMRMANQQGGEQFQANVLGLPIIERSLLISWDSSHTAVMLDKMKENENEDTYFAHRTLLRAVGGVRDVAVKSRQDLGVVNLTSYFLPTSPRALDSIDQMVITGDRFLGDTTAVRQLRSWLRSGGRMWVMLDQIDPGSVQKLLGDAASYSVVDRVELNDFEMQEVVVHRSATKKQNESWSSERPVKMLRVVADGGNVHCRINGWPVAFWKDFGQGEILFTTLGPRGWFRGDVPLHSFSTLAQSFFVKRLPPPSHTAEIAKSLENDIGYQIPSRTLILAVLAAHLLVVLLAAVWLARRQCLQLMAFVVPVAALVVTGSLIAVGKNRTRAVPSTIATGQIARVSAEDAEVQVETLAAIYSQQGRPLSIESSPTTTTMLSADDLQDETKRILWTDDGRSHWLFVDQSPGVVRHVSSESAVTFPDTCSVKGRFNEDGFVGQLQGLAADQCQDPVIVAANAPTLSASLSATSDTFRGGFDDLLLRDQYIDDALMSDRQRYRQNMLRQLISPGRHTFGRKPTLLAWTDAIDSGVEFDDGYQRRGWVLMSIPIQLQRLPANTNFKLPATFLRLEAYQGVSLVFNGRTGQWLDQMNKPAFEQLQFMVPPELLPCRVKRAELAIRINAPGRTLEIRGLVDGNYVTLHRKKDPSGLLKFDIQRQDALRLDARRWAPHRDCSLRLRGTTGSSRRRESIQ